MDQYVLLQFNKHGDDSLVARHNLNRLNLPDLQKLFGVGEDNPMYACFPVTEAQKSILEKDVEIEMDLDRFEYHLTCE